MKQTILSQVSISGNVQKERLRTLIRGYKVSLDQGFWRSSFNSTRIIKCLNKGACLGGMIPLNNFDGQNIYKTDSDGLCAQGYEGNLCDTCGELDGQVYQRTSKHYCGQCPEQWISFLKVIGLFSAFLIAMGILIYFNLKQTKQSEVNVLLRIVTNYFQIMTTTGAYNLEWPAYLIEMFGVYNTMGDALDNFVSIECFFNHSQSFQDDYSVYYAKALIYFNRYTIPPYLDYFSPSFTLDIYSQEQVKSFKF
ncbi:UNKNOWN [Stylonychia lemnae]|uniref:Transmembrane protein n=1 Tax=Stylonychia lemnae TaxID=5949 RepID=A0A077ZY71_STYLE|nr:UNKNOWN [Stylonychia lemnae]|eukprot:CDW74826.1 UNKNOWN [Stylonychia lemnae]